MQRGKNHYLVVSTALLITYSGVKKVAPPPNKKLIAIFLLVVNLRN